MAQTWFNMLSMGLDMNQITPTGVMIGAALGLGVGITIGAHTAKATSRSRKRVGFVMELNDAKFLAEYTKRHDGTDAHWDGPKAHLHAALSKEGVRNYSIFHNKSTQQLFAYAELDDADAFTRVSQGDDCAIWWKYFEDWGGQRYHDNTGTTKFGGCTPWSEDLDAVFYME
eukprot:m.69217 g.69217  ORF g.69217 m.69217 type:complete len:171 (-) comp24064_c0_seq1:166-678(-)